MGVRLALMFGVGCVLTACGGSEFDSGATGGASGGADGGGAIGGSGGSSGSSASGGTSGADASSDASGGAAGDAAATDAGPDVIDAGPGPIVVVQATPIAESPADTLALNLPAAPTSGNGIIVGVTCISDHQGDCIIPANGGVTDNRGNTYARIVQGESLKSSSQGARAYVFIAENIQAPGGAFTIEVNPEGTVPPNIQFIVGGAIEVSGLAAAPCVDTYGSSLLGSGTSTSVTTNLATVQANELAVGVLAMRSNDTFMAITPEAGWVTQHENQNGADGHPPGHSMVTKILTTSGNLSHTWQHDPPSRNAGGVIATFKGATPN